jgi:hypothetical protein
VKAFCLQVGITLHENAVGALLALLRQAVPNTVAKSSYSKARRPSLKFHGIGHAPRPRSHRAGKRREISIR